jgi:hypothetical protein
MPNEKRELQEFFKNPGQNFVPPTENVEQPSQEELPEDLKNRHIRRLESKLQAEREASIAREARIEALSEAQKFRQEAGADELDTMVARIYGTDKPENAAATELLQKAFKGYSERARDEAISTLRQEFQAQQQEEAKEKSTVESYIEQVEDQYGVDLSSTAAARERQQEFRDLWLRLSPKDRNGDVVEYADPFEVYEIFSQRQPQNRAQSLSARQMVRSQPIENSSDEDATLKLLRDAGIDLPRLN